MYPYGGYPPPSPYGGYPPPPGYGMAPPPFAGGYPPDPYGAAGGYPPPPNPYPPSMPPNVYQGTPEPHFPQPQVYPASNPEACPSTGPYPAPAAPSQAYQSYNQGAPLPPEASIPSNSNHPVQAPLGGKRKALLIGINYTNNPQAKLDGCINDTNYLKYMLQTKFNFEPQNMLVLTDDLRDPLLIPTKQNIMNAFRWLVQDAQPGDSLWFSYSGHGGQTADLNGDEADGLDETILPLDYKQTGPIVDDDIHAILAMGVPPGAKLTAVMDCCHSGTGMDLPFEYNTGCQTCDPRGRNKITRGDVICFSGCRDDQTSADSTTLSYVAHSGVLTYCFVKAIESHFPYLSYKSLLQVMQQACREKKFRQIIQMSSGKALDLNNPFTM